MLSKINLVDIAVVLVLVAIMICLMKKMDVVEGLCTVSQEARDARPTAISNTQYICRNLPDQAQCTNRMTWRGCDEIIETDPETGERVTVDKCGINMCEESDEKSLTSGSGGGTSAPTTGPVHNWRLEQLYDSDRWCDRDCAKGCHDNADMALQGYVNAECTHCPWCMALGPYRTITDCDIECATQGCRAEGAQCTGCSFCPCHDLCREEGGCERWPPLPCEGCTFCQ